MSPPLFGVAGWKNSGKTTLMVGLIGELNKRGYSISVIKHAHSNFEIDHRGRDSFKMRSAGACQIVLSSPKRFALMRELGGTPELAFGDILAYVRGCDLVLVEGLSARHFPRSRSAGMVPLPASLYTELSPASWRLPLTVPKMKMIRCPCSNWTTFPASLTSSWTDWGLKKHDGQIDRRLFHSRQGQASAPRGACHP